MRRQRFMKSRMILLSLVIRIPSLPRLAETQSPVIKPSPSYQFLVNRASPFNRNRGPAHGHFFTTDGFCIIRATTSDGGALLANFADSANLIQLSTPNDPNVQASGVLRRAGS